MKNFCIIGYVLQLTANLTHIPWPSTPLHFSGVFWGRLERLWRFGCDRQHCRHSAQWDWCKYSTVLGPVSPLISAQPFTSDRLRFQLRKSYCTFQLTTCFFNCWDLTSVFLSVSSAPSFFSLILFHSFLSPSSLCVVCLLLTALFHWRMEHIWRLNCCR